MEERGKGADSAYGAPAVDQGGPDSVEGREMGNPEHVVGKPGPGGGTSAYTVARHDGGDDTTPGPEGVSGLGLCAGTGA